jgi:hypothetical protein
VETVAAFLVVNRLEDPLSDEEDAVNEGLTIELDTPLPFSD